MKNKKGLMILLIALLIVLLASVALVIGFNVMQTAESSESGEKEIDLAYFSAYTDLEVFQEVPALIAKQTKIGDAYNSGDDTYMIEVNGTTEDDYKQYLKTLEEAGFKKHSDNGEDAMEGYAMTASYTKNDLSVTVSYGTTMEKTFVSASTVKKLSEHLIYKDEYVANNIPGAKTTVHMLELNDIGNSFIIKLKNGHFVIHDGGKGVDAPYLLDYLESLTPEGEKPVIEAWFDSHAHTDHDGAVKKIAGNIADSNRVYVEGFYFVAPGPDVLTMMGSTIQMDVSTANMAFKSFKTQDGQRTPIYRPQFGQRYYFCDIYIDVCLTLEQQALDSYQTANLNETSLWLMHYIEGQKFLVIGDSYNTTQRMATYTFDKSYFEVDIYATPHHGINVYDYFVDYVQPKTVLYTCWLLGSIYTDPSLTVARIPENQQLQAKALESISWGEGTVVLTFPYKVGTAEILEPCDWRYNNGKPERQEWK